MSKDVPKKKRNTVLRAGRDNEAKQQSLLSRGRTPVTFGLQITLSFTVQLSLLLALNMTDQGRGGGVSLSTGRDRRERWRGKGGSVLLVPWFWQINTRWTKRTRARERIRMRGQYGSFLQWKCVTSCSYCSSARTTTQLQMLKSLCVYAIVSWYELYYRACLMRLVSGSYCRGEREGGEEGQWL